MKALSRLHASHLAFRFLICIACLFAVSVADATDGPTTPAPTDAAIADMDVQSSLVVWTPLMKEAMGLTVSGPHGVESLTFEIGETISWGPVDDTGTLRPDGSYTYRLVALPKVDSTEVDAADNGRSQTIDRSDRPQHLSQAGSFSIRGGQFLDPLQEEAHPAPQPKANKDQVILDDLIVDGSACIGTDCVNGESFGFDTLRFKEVNLRLHFQDTSSSPGYPSNDWRIVVNDTNNGGLNRFSIEDTTAGHFPFTLEAGAPRDSIYLDSNGFVGLGTSTPAKKVQMTYGDSPTLRLEQDGSQGFTPHTWDVAGNETNFFIRDVDNNNLPFRVRVGAPEDSLYVDPEGDVGLGTNSPAKALHLVRNNGNAGILVDEGADDPGIYTLLDLRTSGGSGLDLRPRFTMTHGGVPASWNFDILNNGNFAFIRGGGGGVFTFTSAGDLRIDGEFISNGTTLNVPDYVFADDYHLMPLDDVKAFIEAESHLPHVPSAAEIVEDNLNLTDMQLTLLRKVEELTLYTLDQHTAIQDQREVIRQNQETIAALQRLTETQQELIEQLLAQPND